jgi:hypothetical protein
LVIAPSIDTHSQSRPFNADFHGRENNQSYRAQNRWFLGDLPL